MLSDVLNSQWTIINHLAEAWLAAGAESFSIAEGDRVVACWPAGVACQLPDLTVPIQLGNGCIGELRVSGVVNSAVHTRLAADALLISRLVSQEDELERMTAELVERHDQILALYELTQTTRSHLEIDQTLQSLAQAAVRLLKVSSAFTLLLVTGSMQLVHAPAPLLDEATLLELFLQMQFSNQELLLSNDTASWPLSEDIRNIYLLPIRVREDAMAALGLINKPGGFTSPDLKLARAIVEQAAAQIENVVLHQESLDKAKLQTEMDLARRVQLHLLPQSLPQVGGLDVAAESRPALHVGGDFYDFIVQPDRPLTFTLGDVTGKGMSAALMMAVTRTMIRSKISTLPVITPDALMNQINADLYDDFTEVGMFATMFIGHYDPERRELVYANAGHSPVIYCPAGGKARLLEADGTAIGVLPLSLCENSILSFQPGDVLVVATDGFNETHNHAQELFGMDRLLRTVEQIAAEHSAQEIRTLLFECVETFGAGDSQQDDRTLVVLKGEV